MQLPQTILRHYEILAITQQEFQINSCYGQRSLVVGQYKTAIILIEYVQSTKCVFKTADTSILINSTL